MPKEEKPPALRLSSRFIIVQPVTSQEFILHALDHANFRPPEKGGDIHVQRSASDSHILLHQSHPSPIPRGSYSRRYSSGPAPTTMTSYSSPGIVATPRIDVRFTFSAPLNKPGATKAAPVTAAKPLRKSLLIITPCYSPCNISNYFQTLLLTFMPTFPYQSK